MQNQFLASVEKKIETNRSDHKMPVFGDLLLDNVHKSATPHRGSPKGNGSPKMTDRSIHTPLGGSMRKDLDVISEDALNV